MDNIRSSILATFTLANTLIITRFQLFRPKWLAHNPSRCGQRFVCSSYSVAYVVSGIQTEPVLPIWGILRRYLIMCASKRIFSSRHKQYFAMFKMFTYLKCILGKWVPTIAKKIHDENPYASIKINLAGLGIGNGWISPEDSSIYADYLYAVRISNYFAFIL